MKTQFNPKWTEDVQKRSIVAPKEAVRRMVKKFNNIAFKTTAEKGLPIKKWPNINPHTRIGLEAVVKWCFENGLPLTAGAGQRSDQLPTPTDSRQPEGAHPGVWCCERRGQCKWKCYALEAAGLQWGTPDQVTPEWLKWHKRECGGRLVQLVPPNARISDLDNPKRL